MTPQQNEQLYTERERERPKWAQGLRCGGWTDRDPINKKHFRPGGMAPSEWTRSIRALRDTPVAD